MRKQQKTEKNRKSIRGICIRLVQASYVLFWWLQAEMTVFAATKEKSEPATVTKGLNNLKTIFLGAVAAYGAIQVAHWVSEFGDAFSQKDGQQMRRAGRGIAGGLIEVGISAFLAFVTA